MRGLGGADPEVGEGREGEQPLVGGVVDGEHRAHLGEPRVFLGALLEEGGDDPGGPVVEVDEIGHLGLHAHPRHGALAEQAEAQVVVLVGGGALAVDLRPIADARPAEEHHRDPRREPGLVDLGVDVLAPEVDLHLDEATREGVLGGVDAAVAEREDGDLVAERAEGLGERADDVPEAADLREGHDLRADEEDFHGAGDCTRFTAGATG